MFLCYEENMISDEELLLLYDKNNLRRTQNLNLCFQPENSRFEVRHAAKILPVGVRGTKTVWCLSSLIHRLHGVS